MMRFGWLTSILVTALGACGNHPDDAAADDQAALTAGATIPVFTQASVLNLRIEAPLQDLFDQIPKPVADEYAAGGFDVPDVSKLSATGTLVYDDASGTKRLPITITLRGNTSLFELAFPKLSVVIDKTAAKGTIFEHASKIKIGTHGGESDKPTPLGRLADQDSPHREAFVYTMLETLGIPTNKTRPALVTYRDTGHHHVAAAAADGTLVRKAFLLEDTKDTAQRLGGTETKLTDASTLEEFDGKFDPVAVARMELAESLAGNIDWELGRSIANINAIALGSKVLFTPYDFDLASTVSARDEIVVAATFFPGKSPIYKNVAFLLNELRSRGYRKAEIDAAVTTLAAKKDAVNALIETSTTLGASDRTLMKDHVDAFFDAVQPKNFYLPHTLVPLPVYSDAKLTKRIAVPGADASEPLATMYACGSPLAILGRSPDGKSVHVSFLYADFAGAKDGWLATSDVIGADGKVPANVDACTRPGTD